MTLRRVVDDLHGFCVAGVAAADGFVLGGVGRAAGIAGSGTRDAFNVFEDGLNAPEAAASQDQAFLAFRGGEGVVDGRLGYG